MTSLVPSSLLIFHPSLLSQSPLSLNLSLSIFNISRLSFSETKWGNWLHFSLLTLLRGVIQGTARALVTSRLKNHLISLKFNNLIWNNVLGLIFNVKYLFLTCEISENHTCKYHLDVSALSLKTKLCFHAFMMIVITYECYMHIKCDITLFVFSFVEKSCSGTRSNLIIWRLVLISHVFEDIFTTAASLLHEQTVCKVLREAGIPSSAAK